MSLCVNYWVFWTYFLHGHKDQGLSCWMTCFLCHSEQNGSSSSSSPRGSQFSIASIPNDENMRFRPAIFYQTRTSSVLLKVGQKTLLFMTMQKLRSYTQQLTHNDIPKLDYPSFYSPCIMWDGAACCFQIAQMFLCAATFVVCHII